MSILVAKRCILNVATGSYVPLQTRLTDSLADVGWIDGVMTWTDRFPPGSPPHHDAPYGFKVYAISEALRRGFTSVLWLDAPCFAVHPLGPVFETIERDGHCFVSGDESLGHWASDACLGAFGISRDQAMEMPLLNGAFIGLDLEHTRAREWYRRMVQQCEAGLFKGAALTKHAPPEVRARNVDKDTGHLSDDPRCWGHRHDEAVGSCLAHLLGMDFTPLGTLFGFGNDSPAIIRSDGP
ncbi:MAG TPA: hypothetical protein VKW04_02685 [Planctomycetota bacterium]|nr:hypothetical protein [Planctomycetota bacterium]